MYRGLSAIVLSSALLLGCASPAVEPAQEEESPPAVAVEEVVTDEPAAEVPVGTNVPIIAEPLKAGERTIFIRNLPDACQDYRRWDSKFNKGLELANKMLEADRFDLAVKELQEVRINSEAMLLVEIVGREDFQQSWDGMAIGWADLIDYFSSVEQLAMLDPAVFEELIDRARWDSLNLFIKCRN